MAGSFRSKRKNEKENVPDDSPVPQNQRTKQKRTKYQFAPANDLASSTPLKPIKIDLNIPSDHKKEDLIVIENTPKKELGPIVDVPSSQDHVYWAPTPKANPNFKPPTSSETKLPSSPIAEHLSINPIIALPQKYSALNYENLASQKSPEMKRIPSTLKKHENTSIGNSSRKFFSLKSFKSYLTTPISEKPGKSKDLTSLISTVESEFGSKSLKSIFNTPSAQVDYTPSKSVTEVKGEVIKYRALPKSEDSSDVFDDSEDFLDDLDKALDRTTQSLPTNKEQLETKTEKQCLQNVQESLKNESTDSLQSVTIKLSQNKISSKESIEPEQIQVDERNDEKIDNITFDSDFDDSDDDLLGELIDKLPTQLPAQSLKSPLKMTTQERNIRSMDVAGQIAFKQDIEETDNRVSKVFKQTEEDVTKTAFQRENVHRFQITNIIDSFFKVSDRKIPQKILQVVDYTKVPQNVIIRDMWLSLDLQVHDVIHIVGRSYKLVDKNSDNLLILNPDILLSATLIGDTVNCSRRSALKTKLDVRGDYSMVLIVGEIVHVIFQTVLKEGNPTTDFMNNKLEELLDENLLTILSINETKETVREQVRNHLPYVNTFFIQYAKKSPNIASSVKTSNQSNKSLFAASNILDIEENIWSPVYGIRGMIDVTIEAYLKNDAHDGKFIVPLEFKSGVKRIEHEAQTALYTLLMKDRYDLDINFFMLVYTKMKETTKHEINKFQLKHLIVSRNKLSVFLKEGNRNLPELQKDSGCDRCFFINECMTINKLMEDGTSEGSCLPGDRFNGITGHLNKDIYKTFYNYWDELITKEESTLNLLKKDLFLIDGETREKTSGKCICNLVLKSSEDDDKDGNDKYIYTFERSKDSDFKTLNGIQMGKYDRVIISDESGHFALCQGLVLIVRPEYIRIETTRRLKNHNLRKSGFDLRNNQTFETVLKPLENSQTANRSITYRIDKDEMFHGMKLARFNLLNLFLPDGDAKRRSLIVDGVKPKFNNKPLYYELEKNHTFNSDQLKAFDKVLSAKDYALLLGMPGTGKTTVIAQIIRFLVRNGKSVLLTSYTHSAVDNILLKVKDDNDIGILRLGSVSRIHPDVQKFSPLLKDIKTVEDLNETYLTPPVVATTCLGISDWIFNRRTFDYCIVDESSQVSMPVCLGPLSLCQKFILVGDHYQLPPLVRNPEAGGLSKSLFKTLSEASPESVVELTYQYRMCSDIMLLSNTIIYEGRLKCGSEAVANQSLEIPHLENLNVSINNEFYNPEHNWMETVLDPNRKVIFLNHDEVGNCQELSNKENIQNPKEAELIRQVVEAMILCGVKEQQIGIMSFYRAQLRLFHRIFAERSQIEKLTADQFQGRDKDCVIISLVKSNDAKDPGTLLKEWRRVNVAITRAKSKLIIVGSKSTLQSLKTIDAFMNILASRGWFYNLPMNAESYYSLESPTSSSFSKSSLSPRRATKSIMDSKALNNRPLTREVAAEMGL